MSAYKYISTISLDEVRECVRAGRTVTWQNPAYQVVLDSTDRYLITCLTTSYCTELTDAYDPEDFQIEVKL